MTRTRRLLFVAGCLCCLLAVASALPAADPRLDGPVDRGGEPVAGDWESIDDLPEFETEPPEDAAERESDSESPTADPDLEIDGEIEPGNEVTVRTERGVNRHFGHSDERTVAVNGENVTATDRFGDANVTVPYAEEMTVSVPADNQSRTVDVPTNATIEVHDAAAPAREIEISAAVGSTPVTDATVYRDGQAVATTDGDGDATVPLPESAGSVDLRVDRGPVAGERTVDIPEPTVRFVSPLLFPGSPAPVQVSADGSGVPNATVSLESGGSATTGDEGRALLWLPIDDGATVTAEVGTESATATVGNLYLRLTAIVVLVPGFCLGGLLTYARLVAASDRRRGAGIAGLFVALADLFAGVSDLIGDLFGALGGRIRSWSWPSLSISLPSPSVPGSAAGGFGIGFPALGAAIASFGGAVGSLPSLGSLVRSPTRPRESPLGDWFGTNDDEVDESETSPAEADPGGPGLAAEPLAPRSPRAEIRAAWHAFVDRLELGDRETATPGEVARRALAAGYPAALVARLVAIVREIEYGGREPSPNRVTDVRATASELLDIDPDEDPDPDSDADSNGEGST
ncbi:DUF4129 domain-containing protein [Natrinema salifodinae]|uniref:Protein-glutamine gamma-glutamyltransferase-like C-terminal domain-containing protein n=1 Tax=Natrinema salifodinae TaxID=1202768 RepID=A0A1I0Q3A4_9EURY|nr:DUF4129 domain-containing protein [Natrinema salifodinae]SEW21450.1 protein of unknown function [Natrinema salifodinae]